MIKSTSAQLQKNNWMPNFQSVKCLTVLNIASNRNNHTVVLRGSI